MSSGQTAPSELLGLFDEVEDVRLAAALSVIAGIAPFVRGLASQKAVVTLSKLARADEQVASQVLARFATLAQLKVDLRFENPNDVALAAYLHVLALTDPTLSGAAKELLTDAQNCWWASRIVEALQSGQASKADEPNTTITAQIAPPTTSFEWGPTQSVPIDWTFSPVVLPDWESTEMLVPSGAAFTLASAVFKVPSAFVHGTLWMNSGESSIELPSQFTTSRVNSPTVNTDMAAAA